MGIERVERVFSSGYFPWPKLALKAGDRARFHFLTSGYDDNFDGGRFHVVDAGDYTRELVCLRVLSDGAEVCALCEQGHDDLVNRFACWVFCHHIIHLGDNPDPDGPSWKQAKLGERIVFVEEIERPMLIWLKAGRQHAWYGQFKAMANRYGTLEGRTYELRRVGAGRDDTDYILTVVDDRPFTGSVDALPPIEEVFRYTAGGIVRPPSLAASESESDLAVGGLPKADIIELPDIDAEVEI